MRARLSLMIIAAIVAAAALAVGLVAVAGAEEDTDLPELSAPEVLAKMAAHDQEVRSVSGDIVWRNRLLGDLPALDGAFEDAGQSPFLRDGSGRFWAQDERARFDAQTDAGDQLIVVDGEAGTVWVYDSVENTARQYRVEGRVEGAEQQPEEEAAPSTPAAPTPERIAGMLQMAARFMSVEVTGQGVVAGQDAYLLTMTPAAEDTALGSVQAAIDGRTFMPLRVDVTARGAAEPVLTFGFERVSYAAVDDDVFAFTPPEGAEVERETIDPGELKHEEAGEDDRAAPSGEEVGREARRALLTLDEARELVDFELRAAESHEARAFRWAYVFEGGLPLDATGSQLFGDLLRMGEPGDAEDGSSTGDDSAAWPEAGPAAVLLYGEGFGAIALAQTATTPELREQLAGLPPLFEPLPVAVGQARALLTPLGGAVVWEDDGVTLAAFGMVPGQDLTEFVGSVR